MISDSYDEKNLKLIEELHFVIPVKRDLCDLYLTLRKDDKELFIRFFIFGDCLSKISRDINIPRKTLYYRKYLICKKLEKIKGIFNLFRALKLLNLIKSRL